MKKDNKGKKNRKKEVKDEEDEGKEEQEKETKEEKWGEGRRRKIRRKKRVIPSYEREKGEGKERVTLIRSKKG